MDLRIKAMLWHIENYVPKSVFAVKVQRIMHLEMYYQHTHNIQRTQLTTKNAAKDPTKGISEGVTTNEKIEKYIIIDPATKPSIPSMKFIKFIIAIKDIIKINSKKLSKNRLLVSILSMLKLFSINAVNICIKNLIFIEILNLSSINPAIAKGKHAKGK